MVMVMMMIFWLKVIGVITIIFIPNKKMTKYKKTKKKYVNNTSGLLTMRCSFWHFYLQDRSWSDWKCFNPPKTKRNWLHVRRIWVKTHNRNRTHALHLDHIYYRSPKYYPEMRRPQSYQGCTLPSIQIF